MTLVRRAISSLFDQSFKSEGIVVLVIWPRGMEGSFKVCDVNRRGFAVRGECSLLGRSYVLILLLVIRRGGIVVQMACG